MTRPGLRVLLCLIEGARAGPMRVGDKKIQRAEYREQRGEEVSQIACEAEMTMTDSDEDLKKARGPEGERA